LGYGWTRDTLWIVLASLLRAGVIEVTYQGRRFRNHLDAQVRAVFAATNTFKAASFAPRKAPDLKTLVSAARRFEEFTGEEVDVDESAIAQAFQNLARAEMNGLLAVEAVAKANQVPVLPILEEYRSTLSSIIQGTSDDVVNILEGEGESFKALRSQVDQIKGAVSAEGINRLHRTKRAVEQIWPLLAARGQESGLDDTTNQLKGLLSDGSYYRFPDRVDHLSRDIEQAYANVYESAHTKRHDLYQHAIDMLKGLSEWPDLDETFQVSLLRPLESRRCEDQNFSPSPLVCGTCGASLPQIESDIAAVGGLRNEALRSIQEFLTPEEKVERVRFADVFSRSQAISTEEEVDELIDRLREHLLKLVEAGSKIILE
jgi:hypothetical protein